MRRRRPVSALPRAAAPRHTAVVKLPIVGVRQIKLPVSDLATSARWYADLFALEPANEFFEDDAVRGVVLAETKRDS